MTIDEAIDLMYDEADGRDYHCQIAEWLEELKDYRDKNKFVVRIDCFNSEEFKDMAVKLVKEQRNKVIDDFVAKLKEHKYTCNFDWEYYEEIAEQLKVGGTE